MVKGVNYFMILFKFRSSILSCRCYGDYIEVCDWFFYMILLEVYIHTYIVTYLS